MKKIISLLLAVAMIFTISACTVKKANDSDGRVDITTAGKDPANTASNTEKEQVYTGQLPLTKEKVKLVFAVPAPGSTTIPPASIELPVYKKYEEITNVEVEWEVIMKDYDATIKSRIAAGTDIPDMFYVSLADAPQFVEDGVIVQLDDLVEKNAPYLMKYVKENPSEIKLRTSDDGHFYFLAGYSIINANAVTPLLNVKWVERLNQEIPKTLDDFYNILKLFKTNDLNNNGQNDELPLCGWMASNSADGSLGNSFGLELSVGGFQLDKNGKVTCDFVNPRYKEYMAYINKLYKEDLWHKKEALKTVETYEYAKSNIMGCTITYSTFAGIMSGLSPETNDTTGNEPVFVPLDPLRGPYGDQYFIAGSSSISSGVAVSGKCKNKDIAVRYIDFLSRNPEAIILQNYGVEGITYDKVNGKIVVRESPNGVPFNEFLQSVGGGQPSFPHTQDYEAWKTKYCTWVMDINDAQQKYFNKPSLLRIRFTKEETDNLNLIWPDMNKYIQDMKVKFMTGQEPLDKYDDYVAQVKGMGLDKVLSIYQSRQDRAAK